MKSEKKIKDLSEISLPFVITPSITIRGGINGKNFLFIQGQSTIISYSEFEAIWHSGYGKELEN